MLNPLLPNNDWGNSLELLYKSTAILTAPQPGNYC